MKNIAKILLVDDDKWYLEWLSKYLRQELGCEVTVATNGVEAIRFMDDAMPDVVLLDLFMTGPNGIALLHEMQSYQDLSKIPVIICSNEIDSVRDMVSNDQLRTYGVVGLLDKGTASLADYIDSVTRVKVWV